MPIKLAIAVMAYGGSIASQHAQMWLNFGQIVGKEYSFIPIHMHAVDINPVDRARNYAVGTAMQAGADWLLMVDSDTFTVDRAGAKALANMLSEGLISRGAAIVVAPVAARDDAEHTMVYDLRDGKLEPAEALDWSIALHPIASAAAAIMAINLHKIGDAIFKFVPPDGNQPSLSEDHAFCEQIRNAGGAILVDTRVRTGHLKRPQVALSHG